MDMENGLLDTYVSTNSKLSTSTGGTIEKHADFPKYSRNPYRTSMRDMEGDLCHTSSQGAVGRPKQHPTMTKPSKT